MKILCYGDSNTYGYDGAEVFGGRFPEDARWPELLGRMLGCESVNLGLNGRRVPRFQRTIEADLTLLKRSGDGLILVMLGTTTFSPRRTRRTRRRTCGSSCSSWKRPCRTAPFCSARRRPLRVSERVMRMPSGSLPTPMKPCRGIWASCIPIRRPGEFPRAATAYTLPNRATASSLSRWGKRSALF